MEILTEIVNGYKHVHKINSEYGCAVKLDNGHEETILDRLIEKGMFVRQWPPPISNSSNSVWHRTVAQ